MSLKRIPFGSPVDNGRHELEIRKHYNLLCSMLKDPRFNFANDFLSSLFKQYRETESFSKKQIESLNNIFNSVHD
jgi:hypothetical protein